MHIDWITKIMVVPHLVQALHFLIQMKHSKAKEQA